MLAAFPKRDAKAVVCVGGHLGDFIDSTPLIAAVCCMYHEVHVWTSSHGGPAHCLLDGLPGLDSISCDFQSDFVKPEVAFIAWMHLTPRKYLRRIKPARAFVSDLMQCLPPPQRDGVVKENGARRRIMHSAKPSQEPLDLSGYMLAKTPMYECERSLNMAREDGWTGPGFYYIGYADWPHPRDTSGDAPVVAISTGHTAGRYWAWKAYQPGKYAQAAAIIHEKLNGRVRMIHVGLRSDQRLDSPLVVDRREAGTLKQLAGLLRQCGAMLGNDTGLCHLAGALGVPTVALFGPTDPTRSLTPFASVGLQLGLPCQPCIRTRMGRYPQTGLPCQRECLDTLPPEAVADAVIARLQGEPCSYGQPIIVNNGHTNHG